jgi:hypothetical protein
MTTSTNDENQKFWRTKDTAGILWMALWATTIVHAGLTVWSMLLTAKLPPGYEVPPGWVDLFSKCPTPGTYWAYVVVLSINVLWESLIRGQKT